MQNRLYPYKMESKIDTTSEFFTKPNGTSYMKTTMVSKELNSTVGLEISFFYTDGKTGVDKIREMGDERLTFFDMNMMDDTIVALADKNTHYGCKIVAKHGQKVDPTKVRGLRVWCEPAQNDGQPTQPLLLEFATGATECVIYFTEALNGYRWFLASLKANILRGDILDKVNELSGLMRLKFQMMSNDDYEKLDLARAKAQAAAANGAGTVEWIDEIRHAMRKIDGPSLCKGLTRGDGTRGGAGGTFGQNAKPAVILKGEQGHRATRTVHGYKAASEEVQIYVKMMTTSSEALPDDMNVEMHTGQAVPKVDHDVLMDVWEAKKERGVSDIDNPKPEKRPKVEAFDQDMTVLPVNTELFDELKSVAENSKQKAKEPKYLGCDVGVPSRRPGAV